ncbi:MAG: NUDIX domain-containing protein [Campylobacterota bacterium]|nr:NUDIX domain-containing protein [Campylobacterota bacterium]
MRNEIENFRLEPLTDPRFVHTSLARYRQNGVAKDWEIVKAHDSVAVLIYHSERESFILVKQFRPAVYLHNDDGVTIELCAGIVDKDLTLQQIAQEEIEEECGYQVPLESVENITSFYTSVGFAGSSQRLYYVEVNDDMKVSEGGGVDHEMIEVIEMSIVEAKAFIYDETIAKTPGLMFAFMWWFERLNPKYAI